MKELKKLLKKVTTSKNYAIEEDCGYRLYYTGKKLPCGCVSKGKEQLFYQSDINTFKHVLLALAKFRKSTTINTKDYIDRMAYLIDQCLSHLAYGYPFKGSQYIGDINLPYDLKEDVYNYIRRLIAEVHYNSYADSEGCSYNTINLVEV